jgi:hypothetical protein
MRLELSETFLQAGFARSRDAVLLTDRQRVEARQQALGHLRNALEFIKGMAEHGSPFNRREAQRWLKRYRQSPVLAWTRDPAILATLSEPEQRNWRQFWQEMEAIPSP